MNGIPKLPFLRSIGDFVHGRQGLVGASAVAQWPTRCAEGPWGNERPLPRVSTSILHRPDGLPGVVVSWAILLCAADGGGTGQPNQITGTVISLAGHSICFQRPLLRLLGRPIWETQSSVKCPEKNLASPSSPASSADGTRDDECAPCAPCVPRGHAVWSPLEISGANMPWYRVRRVASQTKGHPQVPCTVQSERTALDVLYL